MELATLLRKAWGDDFNFEQIMAIQGDVFRDVSGRRTLRFTLAKSSFFIKIHSGVGWREIFKNLIQGKLPVLGARNEYKAIRKLEALGVETMTIAGFGERGINPAKIQSFLITEDLQDTVSLEDFCAGWPKQRPVFTLKLRLIEKLASIARALHENGVNHRDFYICHFLLEPSSIERECLKVFLIDLHRAQIRTKTPKRWLIKDLAGLYFSALHIGLTERDFLRFISLYRAQSLRSIFVNEASFWQEVARKAHRLDVMTENKKNL